MNNCKVILNNSKKLNASAESTLRRSVLNYSCNILVLMIGPQKFNISDFQEPFIDVAIGGSQIPAGNPGDLLVWAVTAHGRVISFVIDLKTFVDCFNIFIFIW